jgi:hypothetical protein
MARKKFSEDRMAQILVEAAYRGDYDTAAKHGIHVRTIQRWRDLSEINPRLSRLIAEKKVDFERGWADEAAGALKAGLEFLKSAAQSVDKKDPAAIHAVAGAVKIASEVLITREVLDARLSGTSREDDSQD